MKDTVEYPNRRLANRIHAMANRAEQAFMRARAVANAAHFAAPWNNGAKVTQAIKEALEEVDKAMTEWKWGGKQDSRKRIQEAFRMALEAAEDLAKDNPVRFALESGR